VAALVARGLSNRQIAKALAIGPRTAENHVKHILARLGARSRVRIAAWAAAQARPAEATLPARPRGGLGREVARSDASTAAPGQRSAGGRPTAPAPDRAVLRGPLGA
jgi:hypothetical protein